MRLRWREERPGRRGGGAGARRSVPVEPQGHGPPRRLILRGGLQLIFLDVETDHLIRSRMGGEGELSSRTGGDGLRVMALDPDAGSRDRAARPILDSPEDLRRAVRLELDR